MEKNKCVVCGAPATRGKWHPLCEKHRGYVYKVHCSVCGIEVYRKERNKAYRCPDCLNKPDTSGPKAGTAERERILKYLSKAKTSFQIQEQFGDDWREKIHLPMPGFNLFQQRNDWGQETFVFLPQIRTDAQVKPKIWQHHVGLDESGLMDPFILVQMPDEAFLEGEIVIVPLFDVHIGHVAHRDIKFSEYVSWIADTPNVFAFLGGDILENALEDGRGMTLDQQHQPPSQLQIATNKLLPIAHKILFTTTGNHEARSQVRTGIDPLMVLAERLNIPYFDGPVFMTICAASYYWHFYVFHGTGNSTTKGGKLNSAQRANKYIDFVHFNVSGHVHDPMINWETVIGPDLEFARLRERTRWTVIAQSFLGWKRTYAYRKGLAPPARGGVSCIICNDGSHRVRQA